MLEDIKKELLNHPDKLKDVLEHFGYCNIIIREKYMQFGRDEVSSKKSIVIKLKENKFLYVHDYARNIQKDLFSYIMSQRHVEFSDVLNEVKKVIGITDYYDFFERRGIFGGFYERVRKRRTNSESKIYDESVLNEFSHFGNLRFLQDNIYLENYHCHKDFSNTSIEVPESFREKAIIQQTMM